jgi:hypothetical protein
MEESRDYKTSMYASSFDMSMAFDSVDRNLLVACLVRLWLPEELAEHMVGLDLHEQIFVKCPKNLEIADRGLVALNKEGYKFKSMKGVGQGDKPSPLYWVAVIDTLLCALRKRPSGFRVQDLDGNTYPAEDMAYADDLQSMEATAGALQEKADIVSGWCQYTGIQISITKLRTFGTHWGVFKGDNPPLLIHGKDWKKTEVEMKMDGTMKCLGVKFDMHVDNQVQLAEYIETVDSKGDKIVMADVRRRDKMLAVGYCLLQNIVYRSQHCPWHLEEFEELDRKYVGLVKKVAKLIFKKDL